MNHPNKQAPRVALVTGAARRIGAAIAKTLHQAGFRVVIHCHTSTKAANDLAQQMNKERNDSALVLTADLTIKNEAIKLIHDALHWGKQLNVLINNASFFAKTSISAVDDEQWDLLFTTNVKAPFWLSQTAYPFLIPSKGSIINITDIHAQRPLLDYSVYCQTKAALDMQTKSLAREFAPNVRVNAIAPGAIVWPEHENALNAAVQQKIIENTPLKQHGNPIFIGQAVLALIENPFITGQTLAVDGGRSI